MSGLRKKLTLNIIIQLILFVLLIVADQITKLLAVKLLKGQPAVEVIKGIVDFQYLENTGAAFGIFQNKMWMFYAITFIVIIIIAVLFVRVILCLKRYMSYAEQNNEDEKILIRTHKNAIFLNYIFIVIAAGAVGNLIDRLAQSYVVDFIYFKIINFPIFNFADICVTVSAVLLIIYFIFIHKDNPNFTLFGKPKYKAGKENE